MRLSPAECAIRAFGGVRALARALRMCPGDVARWRTRRHAKPELDGMVPDSQQRRLLVIARERGIPLTADELILGREEPDQPPSA